MAAVGAFPKYMSSHVCKPGEARKLPAKCNLNLIPLIPLIHRTYFGAMMLYDLTFIMPDL